MSQKDQKSNQKSTAPASGAVAGYDGWQEVMDLAEKYGLITHAVGGVAILMTHENQKEQGVYEMTQYKCGLIKRHPKAAREYDEYAGSTGEDETG